MKMNPSISIAALALFAAMANTRFNWPRKDRRHISGITNSSTLARSASPQVLSILPFSVHPILSSNGILVGGSATSIPTTSASDFFVCGGIDGLVPNVFDAMNGETARLVTSAA